MLSAAMNPYCRSFGHVLIALASATLPPRAALA